MATIRTRASSVTAADPQGDTAVVLAVVALGGLVAIIALSLLGEFLEFVSTGYQFTTLASLVVFAIVLGRALRDRMSATPASYRGTPPVLTMSLEKRRRSRRKTATRRPNSRRRARTARPTRPTRTEDSHDA